MTHRSRPVRARLRIAFGIGGLVIAMTAWAAPGAAAATPPSAGANAPQSRAEPAHAASPAIVQPRRAAAPVVDCKKPGTSHSIQATADLSHVHASGTWSSKNPTHMVFELKGAPKFNLNLDFSGNVECTADLTAVTVPIADTGLLLELGPELEFSASGQVGADFTWTESVDVGFTITNGKFVEDQHSFTPGTSVVFTGSGKAGLQLNLHATIETPKGVAGVEGFIGPDLTATVTGTTATDSACWKVSVGPQAHFDVFVNAFGFKKKFRSPVWKLGKDKSLTGCLAKTITFDGSPGTGAPPTTLGPYTMAAFQPDDTAEGTVESSLAGPTGTLAFSPGLRHELVGSGWQTWSNGYTGDVYDDATALPDGNFQITVTLPPGTGAFYAYVEPDSFQDYAINATANNGVTSGDVTVNGQAGARYFGFYATCGHTIKSITYIDSGGDGATAIGEFGIAKSC